MHKARLQDNRTIGILMGDAVMSSIQTQLMIGGFIIIFSVLLTILDLIGIQYLLSSVISFLFIFFGLSAELSPPIIFGLFEITLGSQLVSEINNTVPLVAKVSIAGGIIAWSGLSVHAQVASMLAKTDIRYKPYLFSRILHATFASLITVLLWNPLENFLLEEHSPTSGLGRLVHWGEVWDRYMYFNFTLILLAILLTLLYFLFSLAKWIAK